VEVVVVAGAAGSYRLDVADVPGHARGVAVLLGPKQDSVVPLTAAIREGQRSFVLSVEAAPPSSPSQPSSPHLSGPAAVGAALMASPVQAVTNLVVAPSQAAPPASTSNAGSAQPSGATASVLNTLDSSLGDSTVGRGMVVEEATGPGGPADGARKEGGNPSGPGKDGENPPDDAPQMPGLFELLRELWEMLRSLMPLPRLNRP
jgi:hypothetical protein